MIKVIKSNIHIRVYKDGEVYPKGGVTVHYRFGVNEEENPQKMFVMFGVAECSKVDHYIKSQGVEIAKFRMLGNQFTIPMRNIRHYGGERLQEFVEDLIVNHLNDTRRLCIDKLGVGHTFYGIEHYNYL